MLMLSSEIEAQTSTESDWVFFSTVGLDGAGKTTLLYKLKLAEVVTTIPTIGQRLFSSCYHMNEG